MSELKYKVGDKVQIKSLDWYNENKDEFGNIDYGNVVFFKRMQRFCGRTVTIIDMDEVQNIYTTVLKKDYFSIENHTAEVIQLNDDVIEILVKEEIKPLTYEETVEIIKTMQGIGDSWECPQGYQFVDENGNVINATKIVLEKKKKEYPKTYEECCKVLFEDTAYAEFTFVPAKISSVNLSYIKGDFVTDLPSKVIPYEEKLNILYQLLVCRDAYWKIAGEEMGLGKPWEPDWKNVRQKKYCIYNEGSNIKKNVLYSANSILAFPTEEMRNIFYENFKSEIEICKEFL